ncbi:MAG: DNA replication and repair protein RecF [Firmicutes bacterium]|nr:DNA replication and repair protein RecF [Bacillota bacterium]MCM1400573.1 DNA replication and repair protein RecF [Bacteroides sp.]MCM1476477.1 DNA replication and repair protein RecF [Bacteroides sp.]
MIKFVVTMRLNHLTLNNFKNIAQASLDFSPNVNCFLGRNGMGKSNLLDAIFYLSFCRSFSGVTDAMLMRRGEDFLMAKATYTRLGVVEELSLGMTRGRRKSLKRGGKEYNRLSDHIGLFPIVMSAPQDIDLIRGSGEERRRWMNMVISQSDKRYLDALIRYNAGVEQRNRLLRAGIVDHTLYEAIEMAMASAAAYIHSARAKWVEELSCLAGKYYKAIAAEASEEVQLKFRGSLQNTDSDTPFSLLDLLDSARRHDELVRHTSVGPHRDDIEIALDGMPMRRTGSQGQCKTFTTALRMAQYEFLRRNSGFFPLLLLDDVFDKLDSSRVEKIMELVTGSEFGQIFVTDTNRKHLDEIMAHTKGHYSLWSVDSGSFNPIINRP